MKYTMLQITRKSLALIIICNAVFLLGSYDYYLSWSKKIVTHITLLDKNKTSTHHSDLPFMQECSNYEILVTQFPKFRPRLTFEQKQLLLNTMKVFNDVCNDNNITYFLIGGALLGSYRHHDIIPWDDDIDVNVNVDDRLRLRTALNSLEPDYSWTGFGLREKFYSKYAEPITVVNKDKYKWKWPFIDVDYYFQNGSRIRHTIAKQLEFDIADIFPVHERPLGGLLIKAPRNTFAYLHFGYKGAKCVSPSYDHAREKWVSDGWQKLKCDQMKDIVCFVHRKRATGGVIETLIRGATAVHTMFVEEPEGMISKPYTLELI